jgi:hypothetical protein
MKCNQLESEFDALSKCVFRIFFQLEEKSMKVNV